MVQNNTNLKVYDNSGASIVKCFKNLKFKNNNKLNAIIKVSVKEVKPHRKSSIKRGQVFNALVIKSKYNLPRFNGQKITFKNNGCILIDNINYINIYVYNILKEKEFVMINIITIACMFTAAAIWLMAVAVGTADVVSHNEYCWQFGDQCDGRATAADLFI